MIESKELRAVFLMLRAELRDTDIPHRTTLRTRIAEIFEDHLVRLEKDMLVCVVILHEANILILILTTEIHW